MRIKKLVGCIFLCLLLVNCKGHSAKKEADQFVAKTQADAMQKKQDEVKPALSIEPVRIDASKSRDLFEIPVTTTRTKKYADVILQDMALDSLKLTGVLMRDHQQWAVFRANDGKIYKVPLGTRVGLEQALLMRITPSEAVFKVDDENVSGEKEYKDSHEVVMLLQSPQESKESDQ